MVLTSVTKRRPLVFLGRCKMISSTNLLDKFQFMLPILISSMSFVSASEFFRVSVGLPQNIPIFRDADPKMRMRCTENYFLAHCKVNTEDSKLRRDFHKELEHFFDKALPGTNLAVFSKQDAKLLCKSQKCCDVEGCGKKSGLLSNLIKSDFYYCRMCGAKLCKQHTITGTAPRCRDRQRCWENMKTRIENDEVHLVCVGGFYEVKVNLKKRMHKEPLKRMSTPKYTNKPKRNRPRPTRGKKPKRRSQPTPRSKTRTPRESTTETKPNGATSQSNPSRNPNKRYYRTSGKHGYAGKKYTAYDRRNAQPSNVIRRLAYHSVPPPSDSSNTHTNPTETREETSELPEEHFPEVPADDKPSEKSWKQKAEERRNREAKKAAEAIFAEEEERRKKEAQNEDENDVIRKQFESTIEVWKRKAYNDVRLCNDIRILLSTIKDVASSHFPNIKNTQFVEKTPDKIKKEVHKAYIKSTKFFHPDRNVKNAPRKKVLAEMIFAALTTAKDDFWYK